MCRHEPSHENSTPRRGCGGFTLVGAAFAGTATTSAAAPAAKADPQVTTVAKGLVGPLSVAQAPDGTRYWADTFAGRLYKQAVDGTVSVIYKSRKDAPEGVSADGGVLRFTTGANDNKKGLVWTLDGTGAPVLIGNTFRHERRNNPDGDTTYGFLNTPQSCLEKLPEFVPGNYSGTKESHPYATAVANGITYVADAGANAILAISAPGRDLHGRGDQAGQGPGHCERGEGQRVAGLHGRQAVRVRERAHRHRGRPRRLPLRDQPARWSGGRLARRQRPRAQGRPAHRQGQEGRGWAREPHRHRGGEQR